ncbi:restriction endonuclease [Dokdonella fugitiva]|uniref:restriction endonuclease n=1 Tax=Dokdonella fugitiva TaxID=328517 RepID=UPI003CCDD465
MDGFSWATRRSSKAWIPYEPTEDSDEIARRLVDLLSPASFEHLVVDVLRLERPDLMWLHVGGTGDGGADGIGFRADGTPAAILQCKLRWPGWLDDPRAEAAVRRPEPSSRRWTRLMRERRRTRRYGGRRGSPRPWYGTPGDSL